MVRPSPRAFTLIELLIVIAIIGILMALLFPAVGSAINAARKASAHNDVTQIATAIVAYQTEYGTWPTNAPQSAAPIGNGAFLNALIGTNSRQITYIEVGAYKKGKGGTNSSGYCDPWGVPYQCVVDTTYQGSVTAGAAGTVNKTVAVWSSGISTNGVANATTNNWIESWQ